MQFLRTLFWVVIAVIAVIFASKNWTPVIINLWGGFQAESKLPVLLFAAFLLGFLPPFILYRANRWRMRRRVEQIERSAPPASTADLPLAGEPVPPPPVAAPIAAPPALS